MRCSIWVLTITLLPILLFGELRANVKPRFVLVIDAGHGGKDIGATRGNYQEKDINLAVAMKLGAYIEQNLPEVKIIYTRKRDVFVDLDERANIANKAKANLFISIHTNSTETKSTTASGAETYILGLARSKENLEVAKRENSVILLEDNYSQKYQGFDPRSPESYIIFEFMSNKYMEQSFEMATNVQKEFRRNTNQNDKGIRQAGFLVLRRTAMPSLLVEVGFINNPKDGAYITSDSGQGDLARAIYKAFKNYKYEFDKKQGRSVDEISPARDDSTEPSDSAMERGDHETTLNHGTIGKNEEHAFGNKVVRPKTKTKDKIIYRVQFLTWVAKLPSKSAKFKGLNPVFSFHEHNGYAYTYGETSDLNEIIRIQRQVRLKFKDAFVVKFRNGEKIN